MSASSTLRADRISAPGATTSAAAASLPATGAAAGSAPPGACHAEAPPSPRMWARARSQPMASSSSGDFLLAPGDADAAAAAMSAQLGATAWPRAPRPGSELHAPCWAGGLSGRAGSSGALVGAPRVRPGATLLEGSLRRANGRQSRARPADANCAGTLPLERRSRAASSPLRQRRLPGPGQQRHCQHAALRPACEAGQAVQGERGLRWPALLLSGWPACGAGRPRSRVPRRGVSPPRGCPPLPLLCAAVAPGPFGASAARQSLALPLRPPAVPGFPTCADMEDPLGCGIRADAQVLPFRGRPAARRGGIPCCQRSHTATSNHAAIGEGRPPRP